MSTLEMVLAGLAFLAFGLPIGLMVAAVVIVGLPIAIGRLWMLTFLFLRLVRDLVREAWDRRRALPRSPTRMPTPSEP
ncbi:hypothetical protein AFCDBAGC_3726 [Methylobacterium cerastii]|uniref:Transmembrane protein n=1 Tax=Methylobacterium cerastii TaxID=932741 RepID=A0ABQ4QLA7_9HYPH|nr:hypothetical protein [Methylobacterium cerastii]GJD45849.1 hypothetical protein AFCDBAGC_3726 [Methylobacterium cerastii]